MVGACLTFSQTVTALALTVRNPGCHPVRRVDAALLTGVSVLTPLFRSRSPLVSGRRRTAIDGAGTPLTQPIINAGLVINDHSYAPLGSRRDSGQQTKWLACGSLDPTKPAMTEMSSCGADDVGDRQGWMMRRLASRSLSKHSVWR